MSMLSSFNGRMVMLVALLGLFATAMYGFANTNTVAASKAGSGSQTISGYDVTAVEYTLNSTGDADTIEAVKFTLDGAASTVKARIVSGGSFYGCTNPSGNNWTCTINPGVTSSSANQLTVNAAQ